MAGFPYRWSRPCALLTHVGTRTLGFVLPWRGKVGCMTTTVRESIRGETAPRRYEELGMQFIAGRWREGSGKPTLENRDPWTGELLFESRSANAADVDEAYRAAKAAQPAWAARPYPERSAVLLRAAQILVERKAEIVEWIVRESGGTQIKAGLEWQLVHGGILEAASYPGRIFGQILPRAGRRRWDHQPLEFPVPTREPLDRPGTCLRERDRREAGLRHTRHRRDAASQDL